MSNFNDEISYSDILAYQDNFNAVRRMLVDASAMRHSSQNAENLYNELFEAYNQMKNTLRKMNEEIAKKRYSLCGNAKRFFLAKNLIGSLKDEKGNNNNK